MRRNKSEAETREKAKREWCAWLRWYGVERFFDAFIYNVQDAESRCIYCHCPIFCDIVEGGGVPDWKTSTGDYGCENSPETNEDGCGGHLPERLQ